MKNNIFVYGSLMNEEVLKTLLNRVPPLTNGRLEGYSRFSLRHVHYPAIKENSGGLTMGKLMKINDQELKIFDEFEGQEYTRELVEIKIENESTQNAYVYIASNIITQQIIEERGWDYQSWTETHLKNYLIDTKLWLKDNFGDLDYVKERN